MLDKRAEKYYHRDRSLTVRSALESLAVHVGHEGGVIAGCTPIIPEGQANCHSCGDLHGQGGVLYGPVFQRGMGCQAHPRIPVQIWLDCSDCVERATAKAVAGTR